MRFEQFYAPSMTLRGNVSEALSFFLFFKQLDPYFKVLEFVISRRE